MDKLLAAPAKPPGECHRNTGEYVCRLPCAAGNNAAKVTEIHRVRRGRIQHLCRQYSAGSGFAGELGAFWAIRLWCQPYPLPCKSFFYILGWPVGMLRTHVQFSYKPKEPQSVENIDFPVAFQDKDPERTEKVGACALDSLAFVCGSARLSLGFSLVFSL